MVEDHRLSTAGLEKCIVFVPYGTTWTCLGTGSLSIRHDEPMPPPFGKTIVMTIMIIKKTAGDDEEENG